MKKTTVTKTEVIAAIRRVRRKLGRTPTREEFMRVSRIHWMKVQRLFGGYRPAVRAAGLEPDRLGLRIETGAMLEDWGRVARALGRHPTRAEYERKGRYASASLETRFHRWSEVRKRFLEFAATNGLRGEWSDVVESLREGPIPRRGGGKSWLKTEKQKPVLPQIGADERRSENSMRLKLRGTEVTEWLGISEREKSIQEADGDASGPAEEVKRGAAEECPTAVLPPPLRGMRKVSLGLLWVVFWEGNPGLRSDVKEHALGSLSAEVALNFPRQVFPGKPLLGAPLGLKGLRYEPVNELGVVFLFGMLAHRLGFEVEALQAGFPDCMANLEVEPGRRQQVNVEFEFESRKFREHRHDPNLCDIIVCWRHNWKGCPERILVVELSKIVRQLPESPALPRLPEVENPNLRNTGEAESTEVLISKPGNY